MPCFVSGLRRHGDRVALVSAGATLTYDELADRVEAAGTALRGERRLVAVAVRATPAAVVDYLGALAAGHVVLLVPGSDPDALAASIAAWDPDVVVDAAGAVDVRRSTPAHVLHPALTLLMATSGSTGSPRLVRLATGSLEANACAVVASLGLTADDRAALTLPLHYCYGLSVLHSCLSVGAGLLFDEHSVVEPEFWSAFRERRGTCLHGVPYTFRQLERTGFLDRDLPDLRLVTQAGGRLAPDAVRRWARAGRERGWRFVVMYGQTEATARMAHLPAHRAIEAPDAVGVPVPGGRLDVADPDDEGVGELVYRGPNVMLGYACTPTDLALGRCTDALYTGDLGRVGADGLVRVVGRRSRFTKPFGVRVDLDGVERLLADHGLDAAAVGREDADGGTDAGLVVAVEAGPDDGGTPARVRALLAERLSLPPGAVVVAAVPALPRLANGKIDHRAVAALDAEPPTAEGRPPARGARPGSARAVFERAFPGRAVRDEASFVDHGGDSLSYVAVSVELEHLLGRLPEQWERRPLRELEACRRGPASRIATLETAVVLRAVAIVLVVGEHVRLWPVLGGAHLLLPLAGWSIARFTLPPPDPADPSSGVAPAPRLLRAAARVAVPGSLWIAFRAATQDDVRWVDALLGGSVFHPLVQGYWFVDALVQILLVLAGLLAVPAVRRRERAHPFGLPAVALAGALSLLLLPSADPSVVPDVYSTHRVLWLVLLGWLVQRADTRPRRCGVALVAVLAVVPFLGLDHGRAAVVVGGLLVLLAQPRGVVPRLLARPIGTVASASLAIYLVHFALLPLLGFGVPPVVLAGASVASGIAVDRTVAALRHVAAGGRQRRHHAERHRDRRARRTRAASRSSGMSSVPASSHAELSAAARRSASSSVASDSRNGTPMSAAARSRSARTSDSRPAGS